MAFTAENIWLSAPPDSVQCTGSTLPLATVNVTFRSMFRSMNVFRSWNFYVAILTILSSTRGAYALLYQLRHKDFLSVQKVFSSLHNITVESLMADGLFWRCFSYFPGPWQWKWLGSQWDSHKLPGFHPKYLKLCSKDKQSFYGFGTTWR